MPQLLTVRKQKWALRRKPDLVRGNPLANPSVLEARYARRLIDLITEMTATVDRELHKFFREPHAEEYFAQDASISSQARILMNRLIRHYTKQFADLSKTIAIQQVKAVSKASSSSLHSSLQQLTGGLSLQTSTLGGDVTDIMNASISENVQLIKSIPQKYLTEVNTAVSQSITTGRGLADLVPVLQKQKAITDRRARMIARDQTRKAYNNLNRGRMEKIGLKKFEWLHTGGSDHPRKLHIRYSGKVFSFDDPPIIDENTGERGIPGQAINCRCRMVPVLDFGDEE